MLINSSSLIWTSAPSIFSIALTTNWKILFWLTRIFFSIVASVCHIPCRHRLVRVEPSHFLKYSSLPQAAQPLHVLVLLRGTISSSDIPSTCCRLWRALAITSFPSLCLAGLRWQAHRWYSVTPCKGPFPDSLFYDVFPFKCVEVRIHPSHYMFYSQHLIYVCWKQGRIKV